MVVSHNKSNENRLAPSTFYEKLWALAKVLRLNNAAAVWTSDGFEFCEFDEYHPDAIMRFLFPPCETEVAKDMQECIGNDPPQQDKLDSIYRGLKPKVYKLLLADASKLADNIKASRQALQYQNDEEELPNSIAEIEGYSTKPTPKTRDRIASIASDACNEGNYPSYAVSQFGENEVYTAVMIAVLTWISRLTVIKTEAWERYEQELRECIAVLTDDFRRAVTMASNPTNRKKAQDKLNILQQENDLLNMSSYEHTRMGMHVKDVGNTKTLTLTVEEDD